MAKLHIDQKGKPTIEYYYKAALISLFLLVALSRFYALGYSNFYGDEAKVLYTDKTVPAVQFLLDQRKGPIQFVAAWVVETLTGGFDEAYIRFPFALANVLSVGVFFLLAKEVFGKKVSLLATTLYALNGFTFAFGRTAQYQSFLLLFSFFALYMLILWRKSKKLSSLLLSGVSFGFAFLTHYDAVLYLIPLAFLVLAQGLSRKHFVKLSVFGVPFLLIVSVFYIPYVFSGYFAKNALNYLERRITGHSDFLLNDSGYTFFVYNPIKAFQIFLLVGFLFGIYYFSQEWKRNKNIQYLVLFFLTSFILFGFVVKNPGTHILHGLNAVYLISSYGFVKFLNACIYSKMRFGLGMFITSLVLFYASVQLTVFIPGLNKGYPWTDQRSLFINLPRLSRDYQIFVYGFPYNREWKSIAHILQEQKNVKGFYTNDNSVLAKYYVPEIPFTAPGANFLPMYFVDVYDNQEIKYFNQDFINEYETVADVKSGDRVVATIYRLKDVSD